jgi:hypothetical protein
MVRRFEDDDTGYLAWVEIHPRGFVVNSFRKPVPSYLVLHRATCGTITGAPARGKSWTREPIKVCSETRSDLDMWARDSAGGPLQSCGLCKPD